MDPNTNLDQNAEIDKALKEFEEKDIAETQKSVSSAKDSDTPGMVKFAMKYSGGLVKNETQAQYALLGFVIIAIIISLFLFFGGGKNKAPAVPNDLLLNPPLGIVPN